MVLNTETEQKIVASAEKLFYQKGRAGTSMQDIADDAGINRTLLNYYFRSKDQLFEAVFRRAMARFVPGLASMLHSDMGIREYIPRLVETVIDTMIEYPQIPIFVLQELSSNPARMPQIMKEMGLDPEAGFKKFEQEKVSGIFGPMDPRQFFLNVLSLCIFPFAARPVVTEILYHGDQEAYTEAMKQRKELVPELIMKLTTAKNEK
ncbi:MAG: TetR family transcriptional regulator [Bacteroidales bacterium]